MFSVGLTLMFSFGSLSYRLSLQPSSMNTLHHLLSPKSFIIFTLLCLSLSPSAIHLLLSMSSSPGLSASPYSLEMAASVKHHLDVSINVQQPLTPRYSTLMGLLRVLQLVKLGTRLKPFQVNREKASKVE